MKDKQKGKQNGGGPEGAKKDGKNVVSKGLKKDSGLVDLLVGEEDVEKSFEEIEGESEEDEVEGDEDTDDKDDDGDDAEEDDEDEVNLTFKDLVRF